MGIINVDLDIAVQLLIIFCTFVKCFRKKWEYNEAVNVINQSHYRPGQAQRVSRKLRFPDFVTAALDGCKVLSLTHRPPLPPRKYSWYSFMLEAESTPGP